MKILKSTIYTLGLLLIVLSCVKKEFDDVAFINEDPNLVVTTTIQELKDFHSVGNLPTVITEDLVIKGVCNSSDRSGNIFKQITIQDETGGILIRIDRADSYTEYPVGRNIFVKLKGLAIGDFNGTIQLGKLSGDGSGTDRIPDGLIDEHLIPGKYDQALEAKVTLLEDLSNDDQSVLLKLEKMQFSDLSQMTYAIPVPPGEQGGTQNRDIDDCNGFSIVMRNSDYSDFAGTALPSGLLNITGLFSVNDDEGQLTIRDLNDVEVLSGVQCGADPEIDVTMTIAELKAMHVAGQNNPPTEITEDEVIQGVAVSSDATGNFFKQLVIQDETGGIEIRMDRNDLFTRYPIGTKVFVKLKDLAVGDFNGNYQIGIKSGNNTNRIPDDQINAVVIPGSQNQTIPTNPKTIDNLDLARDQNTFVTLSNVEFGQSFLAQTYADAVGGQARNIDVLDCDNNKAILRTSGFADFAGTQIAQGNGTLQAIFTVFGSTKQLIISDLTNVSFNGERCEGGNTGGDETPISIADLRGTFSGSTISAPDERKISGIVISDFVNGNTTGRNLYIQDGDRGIAVRFESNHPYKLNDEIEIITTGGTLSEFNGLLQLEIDLVRSKSLGAGTSPTPRVATIDQIKNNADDWESTLVKVLDVTLSGGTTYNGTNGNTTLTDASGSIGMFTRNQATFAGESLPAGSVDVTCVITEFNNYQVFIRNTADVQ